MYREVRERGEWFCMIQIENTEVFGWEAAVRGCRNPMNSWEMSDSGKCHSFDGFEDCKVSANSVCPRYNHFSEDIFCVGANDLDLMKRLVKAGSDHSKFMRMIHVQCDVVAPLYWWKEYDTYKVGTVANSCSTMHKIHAKEFTLDDFSHEHLCDHSLKTMQKVIDNLNIERQNFLQCKDKWCWWQMIQLLPMSYNYRRTVDLNYAVLRNMYHARKNHKLDEWHTFCEWIETLPYSELITM